ncbi:hypothetical protein SAY86_001860 [Trapa natans]|uniref:Uncharacterized protein n=1 Tax=Trapa natans TaxID=22666 RepID=A0AAN7LF13_TRANT|nr:hypothetical protein SAY86_001860 [Trapa natans]
MKEELLSITKSAEDFLQDVDGSVKTDITSQQSSLDSAAVKSSMPSHERAKIGLSIQDKDGVKQFRIYMVGSNLVLEKHHTQRSLSIFQSALHSMEQLVPYEEGMEETKNKLLWTTLELESVKREAGEESKKYHEHIKRLLGVLKMAYLERDEARDRLQKLLDKIAGQNPSFNDNANFIPRQMETRAFTFVNHLANGPITSPKIDPRPCIIDRLAKGKVLPPKGKLVQAIKDTGPLLQDLLLAEPELSHSVRTLFNTSESRSKYRQIQITGDITEKLYKSRACHGVATPKGEIQFTLIPYCPISTPRFLVSPTRACFDPQNVWGTVPWITEVQFDMIKIAPLLAGIMTRAACLAMGNAYVAEHHVKLTIFLDDSIHRLPGIRITSDITELQL